MSKIEEYFENLVKNGIILQDPANYDAMTLKIYIDHLEAENAALRERLEKSVELPFAVIDKRTGKEANEYTIAMHEEWASGLTYCDMEGFAISQNGSLLLIDECGVYRACPYDRFEVVSETYIAELENKNQIKKDKIQLKKLKIR